MDEIEQAVSLFRGTSVHDDVLTVWNHYKSIENDFTDFEKSFSVTCPARCGRCCENFIPDVTYLEALAAGFYIFIIENMDVSFLSDWKSRHTCCPLFDCETKRCSAYRVRPVICRTFSSAASRTKNGLSFRSCHLSTDAHRNAVQIGEKELNTPGIRIPVMGEYGEKIRQLHQMDTRVMLLDEALIEIAGKLELLKRIIFEKDESPQAG